MTATPARREEVAMAEEVEMAEEVAMAVGLHRGALQPGEVRHVVDPHHQHGATVSLEAKGLVERSLLLAKLLR